MSNDDAPDSEPEVTDNERKTGRKVPEAPNMDPIAVRSALILKGAPGAVSKYDKYLKDHKRRLAQLERLAAGELTPSSESYGR